MNQSQNGAVNEKRTAANRQNVLKSTGPRTMAGKLTVAGNGVAHGIYAFNPVVAGLESTEEWNGYRTEMMASFAPVGMSEIAMLIGDKTGPAIVALTYGDVRPDHLLKQAQRIRLTVQGSQNGQEGVSSIKRSITSPGVSACVASALQGAETAQEADYQWV